MGRTARVLLAFVIFGLIFAPHIAPAQTCNVCGALSGAGPRTVLPVVPGIPPRMQLQLIPTATLDRPSLSVDSKAVFVGEQGLVMKFDKQTLKLISATPLAAAQVQQMPATAAASGSGPVQGTATCPPGTMIYVPQCQLPPVNEQEYLRDVMIFNNGEIAWSKLVQARAIHCELQAFAQQVILNNTAQNERIFSYLVNTYGTVNEPRISARDRMITYALNTLTGADFEIAYMRAMIVQENNTAQISAYAQGMVCAPEVKLIAANITILQSACSCQLSQWLCAWYGSAP